MSSKPKLCAYFACSCGGCQIALVNLHETILDLHNHVDFALCPCLLDVRKEDLKSMPDGGIAIALFNGAIRTDENEGMARLLRRKSQRLIAFGACSFQGGISPPNFLRTETDDFRTIYLENPAVDNSARTVPQLTAQVPQSTSQFQVFCKSRPTLLDVGVDYFVPGCPPEPRQIWKVVEAMVRGFPLPPEGKSIGAGTSSACNECARALIRRLRRAARRSVRYEPRNVLLRPGE